MPAPDCGAAISAGMVPTAIVRASAMASVRRMDMVPTFPWVICLPQPAPDTDTCHTKTESGEAASSGQPRWKSSQPRGRLESIRPEKVAILIHLPFPREQRACDFQLPHLPVQVGSLNPERPRRVLDAPLMLH